MQRRFLKRALWGSVAATLVAAAAQAAGVPGQGTWETTLRARDLNRDKVADAYYDNVLNITWLDSPRYEYSSWGEARVWARGLDIGGVTGWRLPTMIDTGAPGCDFSYAGGTDCGFNVQTKSGATVYSQFAHLWYETLGNKAICPPGDLTCAGGPQPGAGLTNTGPFADLRPWQYWFDLEYAPSSRQAWFFEANRGLQGSVPKGAYFGFGALAMHPGDVGTPVPEPGVWALMLAGLAALALASRRRRG